MIILSKLRASVHLRATRRRHVEGRAASHARPGVRQSPQSQQGPAGQDRDGDRSRNRNLDAVRGHGRDSIDADAGRRGQGTVSALASRWGQEVARPLKRRPEWLRRQAGLGLRAARILGEGEKNLRVRGCFEI